MTRRTQREMAEARVASTENHVRRAVERVQRAEAELAAAQEAKRVADAAYHYARQHPLLRERGPDPSDPDEE